MMHPSHYTNVKRLMCTWGSSSEWNATQKNFGEYWRCVIESDGNKDIAKPYWVKINGGKIRSNAGLLEVKSTDERSGMSLITKTNFSWREPPSLSAEFKSGICKYLDVGLTCDERKESDAESKEEQKRPTFEKSKRFEEVTVRHREAVIEAKKKGKEPPPTPSFKPSSKETKYDVEDLKECIAFMRDMPDVAQKLSTESIIEICRRKRWSEE